MTYFDSLMEQGKTDPVGAAVEMTIGLMRGNKEELHLGYSFANALLAATDRFGADIFVVADKVIDRIGEHYSATPRPLVVAIVEGGVIHDQILVPGLGKPEFTALDFDTEGMDTEELTTFAELVDDTVKTLDDRGYPFIDDYWLNKVRGIKAELSWPVDHAEGE